MTPFLTAANNVALEPPAQCTEGEQPVVSVRRMVRLQLREGRGKVVGDEFLAWLDPTEHGEEMRQHLLDAVGRLGEEPRTVGRYLLSITDVSSGKHIAHFAAVWRDGGGEDRR